MTNAGAMRHVVRIEQRATVQDAVGEEVHAWSLVCERRAEMLPAPGAEVWSSQERSARVPTAFKMRWPRGLTILPQMRLICERRLYNIVSAVPVDGLKADLLLSCEELVGEPTS